MKSSVWVISRCLALAILLAGCAGSSAERGGAGAQPSGPDGRGPSAPKRIVLGVTADLPTLRSQLNRAAGGILPGAPDIEVVVHGGLGTLNDRGGLDPQFADAVPSVENGLWKLLQDGRMETTWRLREGLRWHDGTLFTTDDLIFSAQVLRDREIPLLRDAAFDYVEAVEAPDARTLVVTWKQPYIEADALLSAAGTVQPIPLPKHLLERVYLENKTALTDQLYWSEEFVGAGPYKLREWLRGSSLILDAFDGYILGRPKIDVIEVKFIPDPNTMLANLLSGGVDQPLGRGIAFDQGMQLRGQWRDGKVEFAPGSGLKVWPQLLTPNPAIVGNVQFRRALLHADDRQQLVDTLVAGQSEVAHTIVTPTDPEFPFIKDSVVRYEYDPRRAAQIIEGLGYTRGGDGFYRDTSGQRLVVELRSSPQDILRKMKLAIADFWQTAGVGVDVVDDPAQRRGDLEYRATFPGFDISRVGSGAEAFRTFHSSEARTPQNRYVGQNSPNYMNPEMDALIERYLVAIPRDERMRAAAAIVHHMTDQVVVLDQFYDASASVVANRIVNVPRNPARGATNAWNVHAWDIRQ